MLTARGLACGLACGRCSGYINGSLGRWARSNGPFQGDTRRRSSLQNQPSLVFSSVFYYHSVRAIDVQRSTYDEWALKQMAACCKQHNTLRQRIRMRAASGGVSYPRYVASPINTLHTHLPVVPIAFVCAPWLFPGSGVSGRPGVPPLLCARHCSRAGLLRSGSRYARYHGYYGACSSTCRDG